jgi:hypothetical protein
MNDFLQELEAISEDYEKAEAIEVNNDQFGDIPDGRYPCTIQRFELKRDKNQKMFLNWGLVVLSGKYQGQWVWKSNYFGTKENLSFLKHDLNCAQFNAPLTDIEDINKRADIIGNCVEIRKKTKKGSTRDFVNIYLERSLDPEEFAQQEPSEEPFDPFA